MPELSDQQISQALRQSGGNLTLVTDSLGISFAELQARLRDNPGLVSEESVRLGISSWTMEQLAIADDKPAVPGEAVLPQQRQLAALADKEDAKAETILDEAREIELSLKRMGMSKTQLNYAKSFQDFYGNHLGAAVNIAGGGLTKAAMDATIVIESIRKRVEADDYAVKDEEGRKGKVDTYQRMCDMNAFIGLMNALSKVHDVLMSGALARAKIAQIEKDLGKPKAPRKVGFIPKKNNQTNLPPINVPMTVTPQSGDKSNGDTTAVQ